MHDLISNALVISERIIIMAVILVIGAIAYLTGVVGKEGTKTLSSVELKIVNPLLIFMSYQTDFDTERFMGLAWAFLLSAATFAVMIPIASLIRRPHDNKEENGKRIVERFSCIYSNCGFMGIPLVSALYGSEGVLYLTGYITVFNLLVFTHGYMMMKEERDLSALKKALTSPTIIAVFIGAICYVARLRLTMIPAAGEIFSSAFQLVADINTPMAMLIAGATAAQSSLRKAVTDKGIMLTAAVKLILMPAAAIGIMTLLPDSVPELPKTIVCIACACPAATTGMMFALLFDKNARRCSEIFALTTIISLLTLPVMAALAGVV